MKILNLKINNFGKLSNKEIKLEKGINIIYGENESGKSTLLKFIMGMFYGLAKTKNGKFISDYERYTPWNGGEFSGKIAYELDNGNKYEVFRDFKKKNPNIYNEDMEDVSNTFNIDKSTGNKFFFDQTKVDEELFASTIVSFQEETKLQEKEQQTLIQKMSNLASTGEDNLSFQKIISKLNKKQIEEIGTTRTVDRPINVVIKRLQEIHNEKESLSHFSNKQYEIEAKVQELEIQTKAKENELELLKEINKIQEQQKLENEKIKINEDVIVEYNKKIEKLIDKQIEIQKNNTINNKKKNGKTNIAIIFGVVFFVISILSLFVIKNDYITATSIVAFVLSLIYIGYAQYRTKIGIITHKKEQNVENNTIKNEIDILSESTRKLKQEINETQNLLKEQYKQETERLRNKYIGIIPIKTIDELLAKQTVVYDINVLQNQITENKLKLHSTNIDKNSILPKLENLAQLEEECAELEEQYKELYNKNDQINLVKEEIQKAYEIMKKSVTPKFTNNLSNIIEKISLGKYKNVQLDENNGMVVEVENGNYMLAKNLSVGTIDQLYLSLRLGAGLEISNEKLPIILDETFAYWDNMRLENIIKYLNEEFKDRQIILFTCTNREKEIFNKKQIHYNLIELN